MPATLTGRFETRREAELAIEHLVQQEGIRRDAISASALGERNTVGSRTAGSDHADAQPGSQDRDDAPLRGPVEISIGVGDADAGEIRRMLTEAGAQDIREG